MCMYINTHTHAHTRTHTHTRTQGHTHTHTHRDILTNLRHLLLNIKHKLRVFELTDAFVDTHRHADDLAQALCREKEKAFARR